MNRKLEEFKKDIRNRRVAVLGIGISNLPLIKYLAALNVDITAFDMSGEEELESALKSLEGLDIKYCLGKDYLRSLKGFDVIFKTPKVRFDIPELAEERNRGALVTSEMEVFCSLCPARIFAITGSDGKTTTTTLVNLVLEKQGYKCWLGGNIGTPLLDRIDKIDENDMVVLELSSFQLHTMKNRIHTAVITNLSPNHLDVHLSMEEYVDAKKNIFKYQEKGDRLVLNYDNDITRSFAAEAPSKVIYFSRLNGEECARLNPQNDLVMAEGGKVILRTPEGSKEIMATDDILLPGVHNLENYMAAAAAVMDFAGADSVREVAKTFGGVEHRIEFVAEINGISFYNDSIGTSPTRTIATLNSFKKPVILIAGGYDKHIPYDAMGKVLSEKVKLLVLVGDTGSKIEKALRDETKKTGRGADIRAIYCSSLEDAVKSAYKNAVKDDIIVMSPASASFDMFKNFEERGRKFKEYVKGLL